MKPPLSFDLSHEGPWIAMMANATILGIGKCKHGKGAYSSDYWVDPSS